LNTTIKEFKDKNPKKAIQLCSEVLLELQRTSSSFFPKKDLISAVIGVLEFDYDDATRMLLESSLHLYIAKLYTCTSSKESHLLQCQQLLKQLRLRQRKSNTTKESLLLLPLQLRKECIMELAQVYKLKGNEHLYKLTMRQLSLLLSQ
jgi:hypothetical protein